jgi:hypothetical protein
MAKSNNNSNSESRSDEAGGDHSQDPDALDDWTKERIRKTVDSRQVVQSKQKLAAPKAKVPIEENPVFKSFRDGTLAPEPEQKGNAQVEALPPFPSQEHFVGFWKVFSSPTGFPPDDDGDSSKSENLVLRVDGTTAGGPILDHETNQKAAGGTWKMIPNEEDDDDDTARLRIRLVIPPKKDRILVMEGTATKRSMASLNDLPPFTKATFGIPALEEKLQKAKEADESTALLEEEMIYCDGNVSFCATPLAVLSISHIL